MTECVEVGRGSHVVQSSSMSEEDEFFDEGLDNWRSG